MKAKQRMRIGAALLLAATAFIARAAGAPEVVPYIYVSGEELLTLHGQTLSEDMEGKINGGKLRFYCSELPLKSAGAISTQLVRCDGVIRVVKRVNEIEVRRIAVGRKSCETINGPAPKITVNEVKRRTMFGEGVKQLLGFLFEKLKAASPGLATSSTTEKPWEWCVSEPTRHLLQLERAQVTLTAQYPKAEPQAGAQAAAETEKKPEEAVASLQLITGPKEHFFLSGDAVVRGANEVKWDSATRTLVAQDKPDQLYLGINVMRGDVYAKHDAWTTDRFVAKFLFQPSKKPFDAVGLAIGYRFADGIATFDKDAESGGFMVFAGAFWTRNDQLDAAGAVVGGKRERSWRVGVSYSLGTLLEWLK